MIKIFSKNNPSMKYIGLIIAIIIIFNFLFFLPTAWAQEKPQLSRWGPLDVLSSLLGSSVSWVSAKVLLFISSFISSILGAIFGVIIYIEAQIVDYLLSPTNFPMTNALIVQIGWKITRDLANMFFILILLIIAFTTVLRIRSWAIQQLWWKVIVAALLINFSLVIAGFVIDFASILTAFFINKITEGGITTTVRLMANMNILRFYTPSSAETVLQGIVEVGAAGLAALVGIVLTLAGLIVTAFVFGAAAIFLIVRLLHIWLLLIFAPIVWMLWILPATSGFFSLWWNTFLRWVFFAPVFAFMIYLSMQMFDSDGKMIIFNLTGAPPGGWNVPIPGGITQASMPAAIFQWVLVIAMMFGALIVAQKFGVYGAHGATKMLEGWGNSAKNLVGRYARRQGVQWAQPMPPGTPPPTGVRGLIKRAGVAVGGIAAATPGARGLYLGMTEDVEKEYQGEYGKVKNQSPAIIHNMLKTPFATKQQRVAWSQALAEKNEFNTAHGYTLTQRGQLLQTAHQMGKSSAFLSIDPQLAPSIGGTIDGAVRKIAPSNALKISAEAITDPSVTTAMANNFSNEHIHNLVNNGRNDVLNAIENHIVGLGRNRAARLAALTQNNPRLARWINSPAGRIIFTRV